MAEDNDPPDTARARRVGFLVSLTSQERDTLHRAAALLGASANLFVREAIAARVSVVLEDFERGREFDEEICLVIAADELERRLGRIPTMDEVAACGAVHLHHVRNDRLQHALRRLADRLAAKRSTEE